jgi:hypothetical protein
LTDQSRVIGEVDASRPNPARMYDYYLGGKDNFPADRRAAGEVLAIVPEVPALVAEGRAFLRRAVRFLAGEVGVTQFIDLGAGLPTQGNTHEVAQAVTPGARVVYVDNDPVVVTHGQALLATDTTVMVHGDLRDPDAILGDPLVRETIDFEAPVAVLLLSILHFIRDEEDPAGIVARFRDSVAAGSYLALAHASADVWPELAEKVAAVYARSSAPLVTRSRIEIETLFNGFELVEPGLVRAAHWRPELEPTPEPDPDDPDPAARAGRTEIFSGWAGVGRKP